MAATVFMCSSCGMCFDKMGLFTAHNCTGNKRKPIGIGTSVEEAEDVVLEMNTTPQERRRTMFECQDCKKRNKQHPALQLQKVKIKVKVCSGPGQQPSF
uniref:Uncharacterized protein n=1 Tax=Magallana gigas TaxID=29159 RepID=K1QGX4_MAGGI